MAERESAVTIVACSIFRLELDRMAIRSPGFPRIRYLDSMLHMHPARLRAELDRTIGEARAAERKVCLLYGECHPWIDGPHRDLGVQRVKGLNCVEIFLGPGEYRRLRAEGAFFLLPEWVARWQEVFSFELGLDAGEGQSLMREMHRSIIYVDTGLHPLPQRELDGFARFAGLPWTRLVITCLEMERAVNDTLDMLDRI